jgi:hypothetical protein
MYKFLRQYRPFVVHRVLVREVPDVVAADDQELIILCQRDRLELQVGAQRDSRLAHLLDSVEMPIVEHSGEC